MCVSVLFGNLLRVSMRSSEGGCLKEMVGCVCFILVWCSLSCQACLLMICLVGMPGQYVIGKKRLSFLCACLLLPIVLRAARRALW